MATVSDTPRQTTPRDERVYHPLDRLRGTIRRYVVIEGVLSAIIFLGAWFGLALLLDYVVFKAFTWDWVQDSGRWIRGVALVVALVLLSGIIVFRIVRRLTTELSYPALALVLERRFPKVLGDRLITAVELADVEQAARHGYSADMIRKTISEARERIDTVPVNEVFNWRRLRVMALLALGIPLVIVLAAFASHAIATRHVDLRRASWKFYHTSAILGERDVLLMNTPWPRRALVEVRHIDDGGARVVIGDGGIRTARDGAAPRISARAYQWVIADRDHPDGWRPLLWSDVTQSLIGVPVPNLPFRSLGYSHEPTTRAALGGAAGVTAMGTAGAFPDDNPALSDNATDWTTDAVFERARDNTAVRARLADRMGDSFHALQAVFDRLESIAADPAYDRTLRRLERPEIVTYDYSGVKTAGSGPLTPEGNGEYVGEIAGLKEDVRFVVKAEDYRSASRTITLIPPPTLTKL